MKLVPLKPRTNSDAVEVLEEIMERVKAGEIKAVSIAYVTSDHGVSGDISSGDDNLMMLAAIENLLWHFKGQLFD